MKWTIYQLHQMAKKSFEFDETVELNELTKLNSDIRRISPVRVKGRTEIESKQVSFDFTISGEMVLPCSRTLVDVPYPFTIATKELFRFHKSDDIEDEDVHFAEDDTVDLTPIIKEEILLEIPMQVFCETEQKEGAAPQVGKDWQVISEEDKKNQIDPRLADLKKLLTQDDES
ncbi:MULTISPECIES: YceD family protein [Bacillus amyloliquefaciens group]|uniref:YceD family protein n=1 Tax=Bacillus amyloliquefaciens group TaxID=1938374 RepID=UPI00069DE461|nr:MULTISPECIES: DUF177 domain-containing protein [Bacillus amyloliquefaciens group]KOC24415.1 hypothetical protein AC810_09295 [Bacillus velezensis]KOC26648.1 hypothetical protein AC811_09640 [Bacillus velezensis]MDH5839575.1 DUF177 domain-containing protein [Bacillus velezensis]NIH49731.1 DUF177 domain-containing protein [Bacillus velezensis]TJZ69392.1 DUF177 domain-containing protein [Bacillus amyloliquefaciens]